MKIQDPQFHCAECDNDWILIGLVDVNEPWRFCPWCSVMLEEGKDDDA